MGVDAEQSRPRACAARSLSRALEERRRERAPFRWAETQNGLGHALQALGKRESGTARLEEGVEAYRAALEEWTQETAPRWHSIAQQNLDRANALLAQRRGTK
jgi:hypothetical protein